jgi:hypothetical protein
MKQMKTQILNLIKPKIQIPIKYLTPIIILSIQHGRGGMGIVYLIFFFIFLTNLNLIDNRRDSIGQH